MISSFCFESYDDQLIYIPQPKYPFPISPLFGTSRYCNERPFSLPSLLFFCHHFLPFSPFLYVLDVTRSLEIARKYPASQIWL